MTEKAKMLNGELYDSSDKQLVDELIKYKVLIKDLISREVSYSQRNELVTISMYIAANFELYELKI